jgi:signal transduction histidine kinase/phage shock protein PspC (stress-responsive transcriptional regulator)
MDPKMSTTTPHEIRRATRDTQQLIIGGVASGLARHLGLPVVWVRAAFLVASVLGGVGIAYYAGLWLLLPTDSRFASDAPGLASATRTGKRPRTGRRITDVGPAVALAALGIGLLFAVEAVVGQGAVFWPLMIGLGGIALLWRQADEAQRERWLDSTGRLDPVRAIFGSGGWASYARVAAGLVLIVVALGLFSVRKGSFSVAGEVLVAALLGIVGLAIVIGPWVYRLAADLTSERAERVRSQERADMAAHLHDSVLQTLALIQKNSGDSATVSKLARAQERDLRSWLYDDPAPADTTLIGELKSIGAEADEAHGVVVDVVSVGDAVLTEQLRPLVLATREAVNNAARHAGTPRVDVYAEVTARRAEVFVRDRGNGFDLGAIATDRQGVRGSIIDRMQRHGGTAEVRTAPGDGTEVRLSMPISQEENHD